MMKKLLILLFLSTSTSLIAQGATEICTNLFCVNGNVGVGTSNTNGYKLAVKGNVITEKIKVQVYPWADYVFEDDYKLPTLDEVAKHIKENGHLQDIPSAEEVAENGIYLGDIDAKLLQKIEELTLYVIDKEKRIKANKKRLQQLEAIITKKQRQ